MQMRIVLCLVIAAFAVACGDDEPSKSNNTAANATTNNATTNNATTNNATTNNGDGATVTAVTYNTGLAVGFVSLAAERQQPVADALAGLDADFVCLQEVWLTQDGDGNWTQDNIDTILASTANTYPHNYYAITETMGEGGSACTEEEAGPLSECVMTNCDGVPNGDLSGCVLTNCGDEFGAVSGGCQNCLIGQLGNSFEDIQAACVGGDGGSAYFSNGHNGLLLLSKHPLSNQSETTYPAVQVSRSLLSATAEHPDFGPVDLYCTHLTAAIGGVTYPSDVSMFSSYEEEQANQITEILAAVDASTNPAILFGDMNTGPAIGDSVDAELPDNWATFASSGLFFPGIDESNPFCTYCADNTLVDSTDSVYIDHIMTSWDPTVVRAERLYDQTQDIAGEANNLSDHYGVLVEVGQAQ